MHGRETLFAQTVDADRTDGRQDESIQCGPVTSGSLGLQLRVDMQGEPLIGEFSYRWHPALFGPSFSRRHAISDIHDDPGRAIPGNAHSQTCSAMLADGLKVSLSLRKLPDEVVRRSRLQSHTEARLVSVHDGLAGPKRFHNLDRDFRLAMSRDAHL